jgi:hypothetical protein
MPETAKAATISTIFFIACPDLYQSPNGIGKVPIRSHLV